MKDYIKILVSDAITIGRTADLLEEQKISVLIKDQTESGRLAGFGVPNNSVELYVIERDLSQAQELLDSLE